jgi:nuclear GTP-binding protein
LLNILKDYAKTEGTVKGKEQIVVGVIGFPSVGKSSLINTLKKSKITASGSTAGQTKNKQEILLEKNIVLYATPATLLGSSDPSEALILRSDTNVEAIAEPKKVVAILFTKVEKVELLRFYRISNYANVDEFLALVARKKGLLNAGSVPNIGETAKAVILDFQEGKLKYSSVPPAGHDDEEMEN